LLRRWLRSLTTENVLECDEQGRYRLLTPISQSTVDETWAQVLEVAQPQDGGLLEYFRASIDQLPALLRGDDDPLALLFPDGRLDVSQRLYEDALFNQWANAAAGAVVRELAQERGGDTAEGRPLRVLEVGAGGGGTTAAVLQALAGTPIDYLCTDLSPYFTGQQQARFGGHEGVRFGVYDLDADFRRQGLSPNSFDLIVAGDVLHATGDVDRVLGELRQLLVPGGWLVALEMTRDHYQIMTSLELLVRLDEATGDFTDQRQGTDQVFLDRQSWLGALHRAGAGAQVCLPEPETFVAQMGMCVLAARFKTDRAAVDAPGLTAHLRERLPEYMVPPLVQVLDTLPITDNGKIDRRTLKALLPRQGTAATVKRSGPASDLENRLALMWSEALNVAEVGRDGNLFELGGDSLVAAQLAGRILEELPEARELFFDELLRNLLEQPTVAQLAEWIVEAAAATPVDEQRPPGRPAQVLVPLTTTGPGVPRIFLHDAAGSLGTLGDLVAAFGDDAPAWGLTGAGLDGLPAIDRVAATFAQAIIEADHAQVHLLGYGHSALLAVEVARSLTERGVLVEGVTLVAARRPSSAVDAASAFVADTGVAPEADSAGWDTFTRLHTALASFDPAIYAGDLLLVRSTDDTDADLAFWEDICLGDLLVVEVDATAVALRGPTHAEAVVKAVQGGSR
jgi:pyochelin synthetase